MKGLLLKDWYCAVKCCKSFFLIDIVFLVTAVFADGNPFFLMFPCLTAGLLAMTLISYEEHDGWDKYAATLPYTKSEIVSSKYIVSLFNIFVVGLLAAIVQAVTMIRLGSFTLENYSFMVLMFFSVGLVSPAILCPFIYKFRVTKGRIIYYILIGVGCGISTLININDRKPPDNLHSTWIIAVCIIIATVLLYCISWMLSIHFYKKCEL